ncbi:hypothetical protein [Asaccharospora irregularis]|uniref:Uncharacterized protein n=1 Tax=Asaccharospora irregularis DSM 2635 TaxID=1121321 RepID=A0A1M5KCD6_9FIRM|nr:hypothetical protein [Asaccharospora irregularis]SHG50442.1 hypothetical protein SAMN04488530_102209 [Asaccharospora irregularis DSM 2635]
MSKNYIDLLPGPHIKGEPFWCLMEYRNHKLTGDLYSKQGLYLFLEENDANNFKYNMPQNSQDRWVVRGIDKKLLNFILKQHNNNGNILPPLCISYPVPKGISKVSLLKVTPEQIRYYIKHNRFEDINIQQSFENAKNIIKNAKKVLRIEPFLTYMENMYKKFPLVYEQMPELIDKYRKCLLKDIDNIDKEDYQLLKDPKGQCYTRTINLQQCSYEISWSVSKAKDIIKKYNIKEREFKVDKLISLVDRSNIVESHLDTVVNSEEPIIIAFCPIFQPDLVIIDGNHRVSAKFNSGKDKINAYFLKPNEHMQAMMYNYDRNLYKVHNNINEIIRYMSLQKDFDRLHMYDI